MIFLDQDENGSRYTLLDGVHLIWKRCHSWGNVVGEHHVAEVKDTYCPAPYDQFVIQWNGDVTTCCTDYEGRTKTANVFADGGQMGRAEVMPALSHGWWKGCGAERLSPLTSATVAADLTSYRLSVSIGLQERFHLTVSHEV